MTISSNDRRKEYPGNDLATVFSGPRAFSASDIKVYLVDDATGAATEQGGGAYTLTGVGKAATTVTMAVAPPTDQTLLILRTVPYDQDTDITNQGAFLPEIHENAFDKQVMQIQQLADAVDRSIRIADSAVLPAGFDAELPAPDALKPLVWNSAGTAIENGTTELTGDMLLRGHLGLIEAPGLVGFQQSGVGMIVRSLLSKGRDIVHADDRGLVGDGSDETDALLDLFNAAAGKVLMLGAGKTYGIGAAGITIPANTVLIANGSTFLKLATSTAPAITTSSDFTADLLSVTVTGAAGVADPAIKIAGSRTEIDVLHAVSLVTNTTPSDPYGGLMIGTGYASQISGISIGRVYVKNHESAMIVDGVNDIRLGYVHLDSWKRGLYIQDCKRVIVHGGLAENMAPGITGSAGQNAVLMQSLSADYSLDGVWICSFVSAISGEHGFRLGGATYKARNIHFIGCESRLPGAGSAPAGGCGIKLLGPTGSGKYHEGVFVTDMLVEDASNVTGENHHVADFGLIDGLVVKGLVGRKRDRTYSAYGGLRLSKLKNACIEAQITETNIGALRFKEDAGFAGITAMQNVRVSGVFDTGNATSDAITMDCLDTVYLNVSINGAVVSGGRAATRIEAPTGAGAYTSVSMAFDYLQQDTPQAALTGAATGSILYNVRAVWNGTPTCKDGSIYQDFTNGLVRIRKAGAWTSL